MLGVYPDLTRDGYQLGRIAQARAHAIIIAYLRAFFEEALDGKTSPQLDGPSADYPEVMFR